MIDDELTTVVQHAKDLIASIPSDKVLCTMAIVVCKPEENDNEKTHGFVIGSGKEILIMLENLSHQIKFQTSNL